MAPSCSEDEFIKIWKEVASPAEIARRLGVGVRTVNKRRRRIEKNRGIKLNSSMHSSESVVEITPPRLGFDFADGSVIVFSDAHFWPETDTTAYRALLKFVADIKPKAVVCNGDAFDGSSISRHPPIGWETLPTVKQELDAVEDHLTRIQDISGKAELFWPLGNHDARYETKLATNAPEYRGVINFHLKDHFERWRPSWSVWINNTVFKHRFKGGEHAAWNNVIRSGKNIATGHLHQLWYRAYRDYNGVRYGIDCGTLADVEGPQFVDYTEDNPKTWNSGFFVLSYRNGVMLQPEMVIVVDEGVVEFRGQQIGV